MAIINVYTEIDLVFTLMTRKPKKISKTWHQFFQAASVFLDHYGLHFDDHKHSTFKEKRYLRLAESEESKILLVVFTIRELANGKKTIRIISARQASKKEREAYQRFQDRL